MAETFFEQTPVSSSEVDVGSSAWWSEKLVARYQSLNRLERKRQESITGAPMDTDSMLNRLSSAVEELAETNPLAIYAEKNRVPLDNECAANLQEFIYDMDANPYKTLKSVLEGMDVYGQNNGKAGEIRLELSREDSNDSALKMDLRPVPNENYVYTEITPTRGIVSGTFYSNSLGRNVATYFEVFSLRRQISRGEV